MGDDRTCCGQTMKCFIVLANFVTLLIGACQVIVGCIMFAHPAYSFASGTLAWGMIISGVVIFSVSIFGVCVGCKDCCFYMYAILITLTFICQLVAVVFVAISGPAVMEQLSKNWDELKDGNKDTIGLTFGCCAVADPLLIGDEVNFMESCVKKTVIDGTVETRFRAFCDAYPLNAQQNGQDIVTFARFDGDTQECEGKETTDNTECNAIKVGEKTCGENEDVECTASAAKTKCGENVLCKWNASTRCSGMDASKEGVCTCPKKTDDNIKWHNYNPKTECAAYNAATIPYCRLNEGIADSEVKKVGWTFYLFTDIDNEVKPDTIDAPLANCYAKAETFIKDNKMTAIGVAVGFFMWMLLLVIFAWWLACGAKQGNRL